MQNLILTHFSGLPLNDYIRHFEPAFYTLNPTQLRPKRSLDGEYSTKSYQNEFSFNVTAHNR